MHHPDWCDPQRCRAFRNGPHVGARTTVDSPAGRLAAMWEEGSDGDRTVQLSVVRDHPWSGPELVELAAALSAAAGRLPTAG